MKSILAAMVIQLIAGYAFSQVPFEKTYGTIDNDVGFSVAVYPDGSFLVCGYTTEFFNQYEDIYILKIDPYGDTLWTRIIGDPEEFEWGYSVYPTNDLGFIVSGFKTVDFEQYPCLIKFDAAGNQEWLKEYSATIPDGSATSVVQCMDSGYVFCGNSVWSKKDGVSWGSNVFLIRTDPAGEVLWSKEFGGTGVHYGARVIKTENDEIAVCGQNDTPGEYAAAWLFLTSSTGALLENFTSGGTQTTESASDLKQTSDGGFISCGTKFNGFILMNGDVQLIKTNADMELEWAKTYGTDEEDDRGSSVDETNDGGYILCGSTESYGAGNDDLWLLRTDENGDTLWTRTYGGYYYDKGYDVKTLSDGGFVICGITNSFGNGNDDVYLIRTNFEGTLVWSNEYRVGRKEKLLFPNPGNGLISLKGKNPPANIRVMDRTGRQIDFKYSGHSDKNTKIDISHVAAGVYFIRIKTERQSTIHKFIKR